jgi:hypothetical protein
MAALLALSAGERPYQALRVAKLLTSVKELLPPQIWVASPAQGVLQPVLGP